MRRRPTITALTVLAAALGGGPALAQGRGASAWSTPAGDAQRTASVRNDARISVESVPRDFTFLWKAALETGGRGAHRLTQPLLLPNIISYKGFKALAFMGGSGDNVYALDYDLNRIFWKVHLATAAAGGSTAACPGGLTAITRPVTLAAPAGGRGRGGGGGGRGRGGADAGPYAFLNAFGSPVYAISSGGMVHALNAQTGEDLTAPVTFLSANARVVGSAFVGDTLYAATTGGCGGVANGVHALTFAGAAPAVTAWDARGASVAGDVAPTLGSDGTVFVATGAGGGEFANAVVGLDGRSLALKSAFATGTPFVSAPIAFTLATRELVAVANADGKLYVLDAAALGAADRRTPLATSAAFVSGAAGATGLATWQDGDDTRWVLAAAQAAPPAGAPLGAAHGQVTHGALVAFKVSGQGDAIAIQPAWVSRDLTTPTTPVVINGVAFVVSGAAGARPATLYALDAATGTELWNSGTTIASGATRVGPSGGDGQVYVVTADGSVYAFGIPLER